MSEIRRIDQLLVASGCYSRKEAKELLKKGRVFVDGQRVTQGKFPQGVTISVDGTALPSTLPLWIMLHKPQDYVSATQDAQHKTVLDLLPPEMKERGLFPVGRLDKDTEGLLLLTEDGLTAHNLLSPRKHVAKVYYVEVEGDLTEYHVEQIAQGLTLGDGTLCLPAKLEIFSPRSCGEITLCQGKYHQIKRMMASLGTPVTYLKRISMAGLPLDGTLALGEWRQLSMEEIDIISRN
ncbi:MAG: 16S rRNA pseudouridine(516) synthase [Eubacteriales bacterium]